MSINLGVSLPLFPVYVKCHPQHSRIKVLHPSIRFARVWLTVHVSEPYKRIDSTVARNSRTLSSLRISDFHTSFQARSQVFYLGGLLASEASRRVLSSCAASGASKLWQWSGGAAPSGVQGRSPLAGARGAQPPGKFLRNRVF